MNDIEPGSEKDKLARFKEEREEYFKRRADGEFIWEARFEPVSSRGAATLDDMVRRGRKRDPE